jgi:hypothetical protein
MDVVNPTVDERGAEQHPAWALIGASRVSATPGATLFDSDVQHGHYVVIQIKRAVRTRDLHHDRIYGREEYIEVAVSEAQWASFVSTMNAGDGVPCTLMRRDHQGVPGMPYEPRLAETLNETRAAAYRMMDEVKAALAAYKAHKTAGNLRTLEAKIGNAGPNVDFAAKSLSEHAENVVQRSRADIEAMVLQQAQRLGIDPGEAEELDFEHNERGGRDG